VRRADQWHLPGGLVAGFGRCAAKALWFYGFRVAVRTPLLGPVPLCWALVPAAVNEREVLLDVAGPAVGGRILADKGLRGAAITQALASHGILLLTPPTKRERATMPAVVQRFIAAHRNRIEGVFTTEKDQFHLEHHRALTPWGLLTRIAAKLTAFTLRAVWRRLDRDVE